MLQRIWNQVHIPVLVQCGYNGIRALGTLNYDPALQIASQETWLEKRYLKQH